MEHLGGSFDKAAKEIEYFESETGCTIAWVQKQLENPEQKGDMKDIDYAEVTIPTQLLSHLAKAASLGVLAACENGIELPLQVAGLAGGDLPDDEITSVQGLMKELWPGPSVCQYEMGMATMVAAWISMRGFTHDGEKAVEELAASLAEMPTAEKGDSNGTH